MDFKASIHWDVFKLWLDEPKDDWWGFANAGVKPPPEYKPPNRFVVNYMVTLLDVDSKHTFVDLNRNQIIDLAEWYSKSSQPYQPGKLSISVLGDPNNSEFYDALVHMVGCYYLMAKDYNDWNAKHGVDFFTLWEDPPWKPPKKIGPPPFYIPSRNNPQRIKALEMVLAKVPGPTGYAPPNASFWLEVWNFLTDSARRINKEGFPMELPRSDLAEYNNIIMPSGRKIAIMEFIRANFPILKKELEEVEVTYPQERDLPYYSWYGQFMYIIFTKAVVAGACGFDPTLDKDNKVKGFWMKWPARVYENQIWDLVCSDMDSQYAIDAQKSGVWYDPPALWYPCPSEEMALFFENIYQKFSRAIENRRVVWKDFRQADLTWMYELFTDGSDKHMFADQKIYADDKKNAKWDGSALKWAQIPQGEDFYHEMVQKGMGFLAFRIIIFSQALHYRSTGRPYLNWAWNAKGDYINPTPTERYQDCLRHARAGESDEFGNKYKCLPENTVGWDEPWLLSGKALDDFLDAKAPIPNVRPRYVGEDMDKYERAKNSLMGNYVKWKNGIKGYPLFLKEVPIGADFKSDEDGEVYENFYPTYGLIEAEWTTKEDRDKKWWYNWYHDTYGINLLDELLNEANKIVSAVLDAIKKLAKTATDTLKDASLPLLIIAGGAALVIFSVGVTARLVNSPSNNKR